MDSVTQIALGSAVGYAVLGNKVGRKAALYGAFFGTLPDLDVFVSFGGAVENFTYHRSFSHSLLVQLLISPLIAWLLVKFHPNTKPYFKGWFGLVFLTLSSHALLDNFTVYGTQLLWPLTDYPFAVASLFIIDPVYTLPLLVSLLACVLIKNNPKKIMLINRSALLISSVYIGWSLMAKWHVDHQIKQALADRGIETTTYVSTPAPFTTLLWRAVAVESDQYFEIYTSVFDRPSEVSINVYPTFPELLNPIKNEWAVQRLQYFTKGLYSVRHEGQGILFADLRMGIEGSYVFTFEVGKRTELGTVASDFEQIESRPDLSNITLLWERIWDPSVALTPNARAR